MQAQLPWGKVYEAVIEAIIGLQRQLSRECHNNLRAERSSINLFRKLTFRRPLTLREVWDKRKESITEMNKWWWTERLSELGRFRMLCETACHNDQKYVTVSDDNWSHIKRWQEHYKKEYS